MASNKLPFSRKVGSVGEKRNFFLSKRLLGPKIVEVLLLIFLLQRIASLFKKAAHSPLERETTIEALDRA